MPVPGPKPTDGPKRFRGKPAHDWTEVENVPFNDAPPLPDRSNDRPWPARILQKWKVWSSMPHCILWTAADWEFAFDTLEIAANLLESGRVGLATELRCREQVLGTTEDYRRDLRIRYVDIKVDSPREVTIPDDLSELYD